MKKSELKKQVKYLEQDIKELKTEITRLNGVIEGMGRSARLMRPTSFPDIKPNKPYKPPLDWWQDRTETVCFHEIPGRTVSG